MLNLLWVLAVILVVLWALGLGLQFTVGGLIHVLLVLAIASILVRVILGRHRVA